MQNYLNVLQELVNKYETGSFKSDRTGTGTVSKFGAQLRFSLINGKVPLLTTKKLHLKSIIHELIWFFKGSGNIKYLVDNGVRIWDEWADKDGNLGPVYPEMWRQWPDFVEEIVLEHRDENGYYTSVVNKPIDQLQNVIDSIRMNPTSRRHIVSGWNPALLPDTTKSPKQNAAEGKQALPPCHTLFQFNCEEIPLSFRMQILGDLNIPLYRNLSASGTLSKEEQAGICDKHNIPKYYLDCQLYQRSADWFLGVPFNIASYSILTHIIGKLTNTFPREFIHTFGDYHLYLNHIEQAKEQLARKPLTEEKDQAYLVLDDTNWNNDIGKVKFEDIVIINYNSHAPIKAQVSV